MAARHTTPESVIRLSVMPKKRRLGVVRRRHVYVATLVDLHAFMVPVPSSSERITDRGRSPSGFIRVAARGRICSPHARLVRQLGGHDAALFESVKTGARPSTCL